MDSRQLRSIIRSDPDMSSHCIGVFPYDKLPERQHGFIICNLDKHTKPGSHWVALFFQRGDAVDVFDSYGIMPKELNNYTRGCSVNYNTKMVQDFTSTTCGQHCVYFGYHRCRGIGFQAIVESYSKDQDSNDQMVCDFIESQFGLDTDPVDHELLFHQLKRKLNPR